MAKLKSAPSNLLGANSAPFVQKQIKFRQENLSVDPISGVKTQEQIVWQNAKTSYVALASSVDLKNSEPISLVSSTNTIAELNKATSQKEKELETAAQAEIEKLKNTESSENRAAAVEAVKKSIGEEEWFLQQKYAVTLPPLTDAEAREIAFKVQQAFNPKGILNFTNEGALSGLLGNRIVTLQRLEKVNEAYTSGIPSAELLEINPTVYGTIEEGIADEGFFFQGLKVPSGRRYNPNEPLSNTIVASANQSDRESERSPASQVPWSDIGKTSAKKLTVNQIRALLVDINDLPDELKPFIKETNDSSGADGNSGTSGSSTTTDPPLTTPTSNQSTLSQSKFEDVLDGANKVKIIPEGTQADERIGKLGLGPVATYKDNVLAKNLVLTNGTTKIKDDKRNYKAGVIDSLYSSEDIFEGNYNYGFGSDPDWGLVAMPGLEGVDIKSKNMGSLREATVTIRANSEAQFKLLDTIYNRLGYTMFLEWGHSVFFNSENKYVSNPLESTPSLIPQFLDAKDDLCVTAQGKLQSAIQTNREMSGGNYDAFLGLVTNFTWEFNQGGYYTITLKMSSMGDIIESLQVDQPLSDINSTLDSAQQSIQENEISALAKFLEIAATPEGSGVFYGDRWNIFGDSFSPESIQNNLGNYKTTLVANNTFTYKSESAWTSAARLVLTPVTLVVDGVTQIVSTIGSIFTFGAIRISDPTLTNAIWNSNLGAFAVKEDISTESDSSEELRYQRLGTSAGKIISGRAIFGKTPYSYIRFGDILDFIKDRLLIYNSLCDNEPILDIDTNTSSNFCYYTGANMSADPSKVMVRVDVPMTPDYLAGFADQRIGGKNNVNWTGGTSNTSIFGYKDAHLEPFVTQEAFVGKTTNITAGLIMNIYFEYDYLLDVMKSKRDSETKMLSLFDFINELLSTASSCLGGVNKLDLRVENDSTLRIYDQNMVYGASQPDTEETSIINLYGLKSNEGSFVKDFNMKTELTNDFATQITIGAQAQGSAGTMDAGLLSSFNYGLVDRVKPKIISAPQKDGGSSKSKTQDTYENLIKVRNKLMFLWLGYAGASIGNYTFDLSDAKIRKLEEQQNEKGEKLFESVDFQQETNVYFFPGFPEERMGEFVKLQQDFFALLHINSDYVSNQQGMLPIGINATLDGLSGIKIYDRFSVDTRMIPDYYPQTLEWIIKGVSHKIVNNQWTTSLETIAVPKLPQIKNGQSPLSSTKFKPYALIPLEGIFPQPSKTNTTDYSTGNSILGAGAPPPNGRLEDSELEVIDTRGRKLLKGDPANKFKQMVAAAAKEGVTIRLTGGYRTFATQQAIFDWGRYVRTGGSLTDTKASNGQRYKINELNTRAAFPGTSNHGLGKAIDVAGNDARNWIKHNGFKYNWSWYEGRNINEDWHFTYTTVDAYLKDYTSSTQTEAQQEDAIINSLYIWTGLVLDINDIFTSKDSFGVGGEALFEPAKGANDDEDEALKAFKKWLTQTPQTSRVSKLQGMVSTSATTGDYFSDLNQFASSLRALKTQMIGDKDKVTFYIYRDGKIFSTQIINSNF
jgi:LAS superfamily LD-carboxypeptidase LdcB